jgi:hypothetical protein
MGGADGFCTKKSIFTGDRAVTANQIQSKSSHSIPIRLVVPKTPKSNLFPSGFLTKLLSTYNLLSVNDSHVFLTLNFPKVVVLPTAVLP